MPRKRKPVVPAPAPTPAPVPVEPVPVPVPTPPAPGVRQTRIDPATMSGPWYERIPPTVALDPNSASKSRTLASAQPKMMGLKWVTTWFSLPSDPLVQPVYRTDPQYDVHNWGNVRAELVEPVRIPPNFSPNPGSIAADGWEFDGWGCVVDPARQVGWAGWRMERSGAGWAVSTAHSFAVPGRFTGVTDGLGRGDGLPVIAGSITVQEAAAAMADTTDSYVIPHALAMAMPSNWCDNLVRFPAIKTDGRMASWASTISQGSRFRMDPAATTSSGNRILRAIMRTLKVYGVYIVDRTGHDGPFMLNFERFDPANPGAVVKGSNGAATTVHDPDAISAVYARAGLWDYFTMDSAMIPWGSMRLLKTWNGAA